MKKLNIQYFVKLGLLSALAIILYNFPKFKLPFFPGMFSVQFSNLPTIIGGLALGPIGGVIICIIKFLFKILTTSTLIVGETVDLIISISVVLVTSLIYKFIRNKKGLLIALLFGILTWVIVSLVINRVYALPMYENLFGINAILGMLKVIPGVNNDNYIQKYLLYGCLPFNLMLATTVSIVCYIIYVKLIWLFEKKS